MHRGYHEHFVANDGIVIEQAQIVTTHNPAVLVGELEVKLAEERECGWRGLAKRCMHEVCRLTKAAQRKPKKKGEGKPKEKVEVKGKGPKKGKGQW
jgi:hypothetical protein